MRDLTLAEIEYLRFLAKKHLVITDQENHQIPSRLEALGLLVSTYGLHDDAESTLRRIIDEEEYKEYALPGSLIVDIFRDLHEKYWVSNFGERFLAFLAEDSPAHK